MSFRNLSKSFRYVNDNGSELLFEYDEGFVINKPAGIDTLSISHNQAQGINQVGSTIQSSNVESRPITISGILVGLHQKENKDNLLYIVRPDLHARLYADDYYLEVIPTATPVIEPKKDFSAFQFSLLAAYPYWQKDESASATLTGIVKRFRFPWGINGGASLKFRKGSIVSFDDVEESLPFKRIVANITPLQDLKGYDTPWPGGVGKNKLTCNSSVVYSQTINDVVFTVTKNADGDVLSIATKGTASARTTFMLNNKITNQLESGGYILSGCPSGGGSGKYRMTCWDGTASVTIANDYGSGATFTLDNTHSVNCAIDISNGQYIDAVWYPMIRLSSVADDTFEPYSNICPISGRTGADVTGCGKNLFDSDLWIAAGTGTQITKGTGSVRIVNTSGTRYAGVNAMSTNGILGTAPFSKGGKYTVSFDISGTLTATWNVGLRRNNGNTFDGSYRVVVTEAGHYSFTFDIDNLAENYYISASRVGNSTEDFDVTISNFQIEMAEIESAYVDYGGTTLSIQFNGTYYGCHVDIFEDGSCDVVAETVCVAFDGSTTGKKMTNLGTFYSTPVAYAPFADGYEFGRGIQPGEAEAKAKGGKCSHLGYTDLASLAAFFAKSQSYCFRNNDSGTFQIRLYNKNCTTLAEYNSWLNDLYTGGTPLQVV